ncbi:hypothetical protein NYQ10_06145 [Flavobacterium johnsoniae]|uniref:hypothetical protein n=1 Tax=Flavobacterium johnsoniae TaxID=986 RepID=UPI0025AFEC81|nr:hypothetical protein [Flavobacterium johnsoniae]WJS96034.1 hypothetical protein NYQ10_06145 [Flavobacterium johnsoniae]
MKKILNYISIAVVAFALFSCNKNEWTPEVEAEFKKLAKEEMTSGEDKVSDQEATEMVNCMTEKIKKQNILPNDVEKTENEAILTKIAMECAKESMKK